MTMRSTYWFKCDCCGEEAYMLVDNSPVHQRTAPPEGWTTLKVGDNPSTPTAHLCTPCSNRLTDLFKGGLLGQASSS